MSLYQSDKKSINIFALISEMVEWKNQEETSWLKEVNSQALQASLKNLDMAYTRFFKEKKGFPKFKSKHDNNKSFHNPQNTKVDWENNLIWIPKLKSGIKTALHRKFEGKIKTSTVSQTPSGKYFISILVEVDSVEKIKPIPDENLTLGIDLGIKTYATLSNGVKIDNPRHLNKKLKQLKRQQRKLSRKKKGSNNRNKQRIKVARIYEKITNCRKDFLHKLTKNLVDSQDYNSIAIEDLSVAKMLKTGKKNNLSKHIADAGWGEFRRHLTYKCEWSGKNLLVIGRFDPSSKLCSCGHLNSELKLSDREWTCPKCRITHDRDQLAAQNIKRFAFCKQDTSKQFSVPQELRKPYSRKRMKKPVESCVSDSLNQEASTALA